MTPEKAGEVTSTKSKKNALINPNIDGGWAWVVVAAALISSVISSGLYYTFSMYYVLLLEEFQSSRALTAWVGSFNNGIYMLAGPLATVFINRIGARCTVMLGGVFVMIGFACSSLAPNLQTLFLTYGIVAAFGSNLSYMGFTIALSTYFRAKYSVALSIAQSGFGIGMLVCGPACQFLILNYGWRGSFLICGSLGFQFTLFGALIFPIQQTKDAGKKEESDEIVHLLNDPQSKTLETLEPLPLSVIIRDVRGFMIYLNSFLWMLATLILVILLADFATSISLGGYYIYMLSSMGVGDLIGRFSIGPFVDYFRISVIKLNTVAQLVCALSIFSFLFVSNGIQMIVQGFFFSITYGCQCVTMALVPRHIFGSHNLSIVLGMSMFFGGIGILIGPPVAGLLVDVTGSYVAAFTFSGVAQLAASIVSLVCLYLRPQSEANHIQQQTTHV